MTSRAAITARIVVSRDLYSSAHWSTTKRPVKSKLTAKTVVVTI